MDLRPTADPPAAGHRLFASALLFLVTHGLAYIFSSGFLTPVGVVLVAVVAHTNAPFALLYADLVAAMVEVLLMLVVAAGLARAASWSIATGRVLAWILLAQFSVYAVASVAFTVGAALDGQLGTVSGLVLVVFIAVQAFLPYWCFDAIRLLRRARKHDEHLHTDAGASTPPDVR